MERPRLALVNAAHDAAGPRRNFQREVDADLIEYHVAAGDLPPDPHGGTLDIDGVLVTGSRSSVYDDEEWIKATIDWLGAAIDAGYPTLGVCFGHQAVASAIGGTVEDMGEYELGYREIRHDGGPLFAGISDPFLAFTTHSDTVTALPESATVLAENEYGVQAFSTESAWGVQFHPEYDRATAERVTRRKDLPQDRIDAVLEGITNQARDRAAEAAIVFENFLAVIRDGR